MNFHTTPRGDRTFIGPFTPDAVPDVVFCARCRADVAPAVQYRHGETTDDGRPSLVFSCELCASRDVVFYRRNGVALGEYDRQRSPAV